MNTGDCRAGTAFAGIVALMFSSAGGRFTPPEFVVWPEEVRLRALFEFALELLRAVVEPSRPAVVDGALAMGTGSGMLVVEGTAGVGSTGICVVVGAGIMGACCCAVGCGWLSTTGALPLYGSGPYAGSGGSLVVFGKGSESGFSNCCRSAAVRALCGVLLTSGYARSCARRSVGEAEGMAAMDARQ
jgi:hypothetical protein